MAMIQMSIEEYEALRKRHTNQQYAYQQRITTYMEKLVAALEEYKALVSKEERK